VSTNYPTARRISLFRAASIRRITNTISKQVVSPFQAILDYEISQHIPPGYVNHTISATAPNGAWQQIERGEIPLDDAFFTSWKSELCDPNRWTAYWKHILSDPKKADLIPAKFKDSIARDGIPPAVDIDAKAMFWNMMRMARSPDPYMYPALKKLKASGRFLMAGLSNTTIFPPGIIDDQGREFINGIPKDEIADVSKKAGVEVGVPVDGAGGGAGDELKEDIRSNFEIFISSAHVGMRKPEPRIYEFALKEVQKLGREKGIDIKPGDIVFLDDIGVNLKAARQAGMGTIKVNLGRTKDAVRELEQRVGLKLLAEESRL
jgi:FMN phosphatase YigB (HAD superfamily)